MNLSFRSNWLLLTLIILFFGFAWLSGIPFVRHFDKITLETIHSFDPSLLRFLLVPFAILGSVEISVTMLLLFSIWFYQKGERKKACWTLCALFVLTVIELIMKQTFHHPPVPKSYQGRFPHVPGIGKIDIETQFSFPSGHSLRSSLCLGTALIWFDFIRPYLKVLIPLALVYLGIQAFALNFYGYHWLSDIMGGYWLTLIAIYTGNKVIHHGL